MTIASGALSNSSSSRAVCTRRRVERLSGCAAGVELGVGVAVSVGVAVTVGVGTGGVPVAGGASYLGFEGFTTRVAGNRAEVAPGARP